MAIIFNEIEYCKKIDQSSEKISKTKDIVLLIKWYRSQGVDEEKIKEKIYEKVECGDASKITKAYQFAKDKEIHQPKEIVIYKEELDLIQKELNYEYQKYLFIALCLCKYIGSEKYKNILFVKNNTETSRQRIYTMSTCKEKRDKKPFIGNCLMKDGFIEVVGLDMWKLTYFKEEGVPVLKFIPYEDMVYEYKQYIGENVARCEKCGKWIYKRSNRMKYCKECANLVYNEQRREHYKEDEIFHIA